MRTRSNARRAYVELLSSNSAVPGGFTVQVTPRNGALDIAWSESNGAYGYRVLLNGDQASGDYPWTGRSATITGLANGTPYSVVVRAVNQQGLYTDVAAGSWSPVSPASTYEYLLGANGVIESTGGPNLTVTRASAASHRDPVTGKLHFLPQDVARFEGRRCVQNYLSAPGALVTQSKSLRAGQYTCWITGTGSVALSGSGASGTVTSASPVVFYCTGGTVTFTVTGSPTWGQCEIGATPSEAVTGVQFFSVDGYSASMLVEASPGSTPVSRTMTLTGVTTPANTDVGPSGRYWTKLLETSDGAATSHYAVAALAGQTFAATQDVTISLDVRKTYNLRSLKVQFENKVGTLWAGLTQLVDLSTGTLGATSTYGAAGQLPALVGAALDDYTNYRRLTLRATIPANTYANLQVTLMLTSGGSATYQGNGTGWVEVDNVQADYLPYALSYQDPYDGARVSEDMSVNISAIDAPTTFAVYLRALMKGLGGARPLCALDNSGNGVSVQISASDHVEAKVGAVTMDAGVVSDSNWHKVAAVFSSGANHAAVDGVAVQDFSATAKSAATKLWLLRNAAGTVRADGYVETVKVDSTPWSQAVSLALTQVPLPPPAGLLESDSRNIAWYHAGKPWASYGAEAFSGQNLLSEGSPMLNSIPEPGLLAKINHTNVPGEYSVKRESDPVTGKKWITFKINDAWDNWHADDNQPSSRSEFTGGKYRYDCVEAGKEYWDAQAFSFASDCVGHGGQNVDLGDLHEEGTPVGGGGVANAMFIGNSSGTENLTWRARFDPSTPPWTAQASDVWLNILAGNVTPGAWYYIIRKYKLHWDAATNPYLYVWLAVDNGPLTLTASRTSGPTWLRMAGSTRAYPKIGLYKWSQLWGSSPTRTMKMKGKFIFEALAPTGNQPTIDESALLALLRSI